MKKIKRTMLLVLTALAAAAMAAPVTASAAQWTKEGNSLTQEANIQLKGSISMNSWGNSLTCGFEGEAVLYPGDEGAITSLEIAEIESGWGAGNLCIGTGAYTGCMPKGSQEENIEGVDPETLPWNLRVHNSGILMKNKFKLNFEEGTCASGQTAYGPINVSAFMEVDNPLAISKFTIPTQQVPGYAVMMSGNFDVTPAGVYGIE